MSDMSHKTRTPFKIDERIVCAFNEYGNLADVLFIKAKYRDRVTADEIEEDEMLSRDVMIQRIRRWAIKRVGNSDVLD